MKLHVFIDSQGSILAVGPTPVLRGKQSGPVFAGLSPGVGDQDIAGYEIDVQEGSALQERGVGTAAFFTELQRVIQTNENLKRIDHRR